MIKLAAVMGPTASGKTALSVELAKRFDGEIVSADSMQIYKGMSIATAKPTPEEQNGIPHRLIDFLEPWEEFSVADYVELAHKEIAKIDKSGKLPIICGGTGLYIDSLLENLSFSETDTDGDLRAELSKLSGERLLEILREFDPETAAALHPANVKRIIRAIEIYKTSGITMSEQKKISRKNSSPYLSLKICLDFRDRQKLYERIDKRVDLMLEAGLIDEAKEVLSGELKTSRQAIGYKELSPYFSGELELEECIENLKRATRRYAKRQLSWFRREKNAVWLYPDDYNGFDGLAERAAELTEDFLRGGSDDIQKNP